METVLIINRSDSRCGYCDRGADPYEKSHESQPGWTPGTGCGAKFVAVSTDYLNTEEVIKLMRPDLEFYNFGEYPRHLDLSLTRRPR